MKIMAALDMTKVRTSFTNPDLTTKITATTKANSIAIPYAFFRMSIIIFRANVFYKIVYAPSVVSKSRGMNRIARTRSCSS